VNGYHFTLVALQICVVNYQLKSSSASLLYFVSSSKTFVTKAGDLPMKEQETPLKTEPHRHVVSLDGLRAIAIISVWAIHAGVPGSSLGWLGVDLFFALSGFLITTLMFKEKEQSKSIDIPKFFGRRFLRLMPAYYLYIRFLCLLIILGHYPMTSCGGWSPKEYLASLWFQFNNFLPRGGFWQFDILSIHLWSLALEEQFYFV